jgi:hypothetical protein
MSSTGASFAGLCTPRHCVRVSAARGHNVWAHVCEGAVEDDARAGHLLRVGEREERGEGEGQREHDGECDGQRRPDTGHFL